MKKTIKIFLFFSLTILLAVILVGGNSFAQDRPMVCTAGKNFTIAPTTGIPFPLQLPSAEYPDYTCPDSEASCYLWSYTLTPKFPKDLSKITKIDAFIPSDPKAPIDVLNAQDRGAGALQTGFGKNIFNGVVTTTVNISGVDDTLELLIFTETVKTYGMISLQIDTGAGPLGCVADKSLDDDQGPIGGIIGPGIDISGIIPAELERDVHLAGGGLVTVKKHPVTGCIQKFFEEDGTLIPASTPGWLKNQKVTVDFGDFENRLCREGIIAVEGSPIQYWGYANGSYYCIGEYNPDVNPATWTQPCP